MDNVHDKYLKAQLMKIDNAIAFLGSTLPSDVINLLDLSTLSISPNSYVTDDLKELFADIVYDCKLVDGKDAYCTVLIEHKSYRDPNVIFQLGSYIFEAYRQQLKSNKPLKIIVPVIFYHHEERWNFRKINYYFESFPLELQRFIPKFDVVFNDVKTMKDEDILDIRNVAIAIMFITQKYGHDMRNLVINLNKIYESLKTQQERNSLREAFVYITLKINRSKENIEEIKKSLQQPINQIFMTLYESLILEGEEKGFLKGEQKGEEKGFLKGEHQKTIELVLSMSKNKIEISMVAVITGLSETEIKQIIAEHSN